MDKRSFFLIVIFAVLLLSPVGILKAEEVTWGEWVMVREPTCTEKGEWQITASDGRTLTQEIPATGHVLDEVIVEPGCETRGEVTKTCRNCGYTEHQVTAEPTGHHFIKTETLNPPCGIEGIVKYECEHCSQIREEKIPARSHEYSDWIIERQATETSAGVRYQECTNCGNRVYEDIPMLAGGQKTTARWTFPLTAMESMVLSVDLGLLALFAFLIYVDVFVILWDYRGRKKTKEALAKERRQGEENS